MKEIFSNKNIRKKCKVNKSKPLKRMKFLDTSLQEIKSFTVPGTAYTDIN